MASPVGEPAEEPADADATQDAADTDADGPFTMAVQDRFEITGDEVVVSGRVTSGTVRVDDTVCVVTGSGTLQATVTGLESFQQLVDEASAGDDVGAQLEGVTLEQVEDANELTAC